MCGVLYFTSAFNTSVAKAFQKRLWDWSLQRSMKSNSLSCFVMVQTKHFFIVHIFCFRYSLFLCVFLCRSVSFLRITVFNLSFPISLTHTSLSLRHVILWKVMRKRQFVLFRRDLFDVVFMFKNAFERFFWSLVIQQRTNQLEIRFYALLYLLLLFRRA